MTRSFLAPAVFVLAPLAFACPTGTGRPEGLDVASVPEMVRDDYGVFAQRCSKCHSLARPLNSGIDDDSYWAMYVAKMRRQPGSGISPEDSVRVLRFLHQYSLDERAKKEATRAVHPEPSATPAPPPAAPP